MKLENTKLVINDMDVNEHERLSNITLGHTYENNVLMGRIDLINQ
jgi:hypothetical protein